LSRLLIENTVGSRESPAQLKKYKELVSAEMPDKTAVIPVFLTVEGYEPSDEARKQALYR